MIQNLSRSALSAWCLGLLLLSGCTKKKPAIPPTPGVSTAPAQEQPAPSQASAQQPAPEKQDPPAAKPSDTGSQPASTAAKTSPDPAQPRRPKRPAPSADKPAVETAKSAPPKVVIHEGGTETTTTNIGQLSPSLSHTEAAHNQATTDQLIDSTEANLRNTKRQLSSNEESTVAQIRDFIVQSRQATKDSDLVRARNLAMKAHLLSDDLAKPR